MPIEPERLTHYACFRPLTDDQRQAIAHLASEVCYYPGDILFREGERGTHLYMLADGEVEVLYSIGVEGPSHVDTAGEGEILGCSALIDPYAHSSTVRCMTEVETLVLDAAALHKLMEEDCGIGYSIQKYIIRMLLDRIIDLRLGA